MSGEQDREAMALGTLLAGEVDGAVDELARYILASDWLADHDRRVRAGALREAADELDLIWNRGHDNSVHPNSHLLHERADRIEADE